MERFQPDQWDEMDAGIPADKEHAAGGAGEQGEPVPGHAGEEPDGRGDGDGARDTGGAAAGGQGNHADTGVHQSPSITCEICGQHFKTKRQLTHHKPSHKLVSCKNCGRTFSGNTNMKTHRARCLKDGPQYECKICNHKCLTKFELESHMKVHKVSPVKLHKCDGCEYETTSKRDMWNHVSRKHKPPQQKYECEKCNKKFVNKEKFDSHVADHDKVTVKTSSGHWMVMAPGTRRRKEAQTFHCNSCDFQTKKLFNLKRHKWRKHERHHSNQDSTEKQITVEDIIELVCITRISFRDVPKINKLLRKKFGPKAVEKNMSRKLTQMISDMGAWFETREITVKKKKKYIKTCVSYVKDINGFIAWIIEGRGYKDPQVAFAGDGGGSKYIVTAHITDKADPSHINNNNHRSTGARLSLVVLQCDGGKQVGTIENRENLDKFAELLKLDQCPLAETFTSDVKGLNLTTGLIGVSGIHHCAYGECVKVRIETLSVSLNLEFWGRIKSTVYFQVDEQGNETNKRGLYVKKQQRTIGSMCGHNHRYKSAGKSAKMKDYFNCQETPMMLGMWDQDDKILRRYPIEPLHVFLLGRLVAICM